MIPVSSQPEPPDFDVEVRQKGHLWLKKKGISLNAVPPKAYKPKRYWEHSNKQLYDAYSGICAYLAIHFEWVTGASSTDHFIAKSVDAGGVYEWANYRLACLAPNRDKNEFNDVLDPFTLKADTFILELASGKIRPSPLLNATELADALDTICRLKLDSPDCDKMRSERFKRYITGACNEQMLRELSPFVWYEAKRQGLL
ncbi:MAG: hypothetical protein ACAI35_13475 [Candidatus Methylacidiphilales bacterium]|nr:hypothetical protein [Candidatus Methylacidiphilales bacterium]